MSASIRLLGVADLNDVAGGHVVPGLDHAGLQGRNRVVGFVAGILLNICQNIIVHGVEVRRAQRR